jgi:hypothetical protein
MQGVVHRTNFEAANGRIPAGHVLKRLCGASLGETLNRTRYAKADNHGRSKAGAHTERGKRR